MKLSKITKKEIYDLGSILCISKFGTHFGSNTESDNDLMIIYRFGYDKSDLKKQLTSILKNSFHEINIVWGDNEKYFYFFRRTNTFDIELVEENSSFFTTNILLGLSINATLKPIFPENRNINNWLEFPEHKISVNTRIQILINSRKGLIDFKNRLMIENSKTIDLRRITKHMLRNLHWCIHGEWISNLKIILIKHEYKSQMFQELFAELYLISNLEKKDILKNYFILKSRIIEKLNILIDSKNWN